MALRHDLTNRFGRRLVQQDVGNDQVEGAVFEIEIFRVLLREMNRSPERLGPEVGVAQHRRGHVDPVNFSVGEDVLVGDRAVSH